MLSIYFGRLVAPKLDVLDLCIWALGAGSMHLPLILGARGVVEGPKKKRLGAVQKDSS